MRADAGDRVILLRNSADLNALSSIPLGNSDDALFELDVRSMPAEEASDWENDLRRFRMSCGCEVGSALLMASVATYLLMLAMRDGGLGDVRWEDLAWGLATGLVAALIGKAVGLAYARYRFRTTVEALASRIADLEHPLGLR